MRSERIREGTEDRKTEIYKCSLISMKSSFRIFSLSPPCFSLSRVFVLVLLFNFFFIEPACALNTFETSAFGGELIYTENIPSAPIMNDGEDEVLKNVIKEIKIQGLTRIRENELAGLLGMRVGDKLDMRELSTGIRRAFKKGIFLDIQAVSGPYDGGIKLTYFIKEIPLINKISIKGNKKYSAKKIKKMLPLKEGEDFIEEFINETELLILDFYRLKGFPEVKVGISVRDAKKPSMVNIFVDVEEGDPLIITGMEVPHDAAHLIDVTVGDIFDKEKLNKIISRIRGYYKKGNYINPVVGPYEFKNGNLIIPVKRGPRLEIIFKNNTVFRAGKLKKEVSFMDNEEVTDETVTESVNRIRRLYVSKGYYYSQIAAGVEIKKDVIKVTFIIFEGKKVILKKIRYKGTSIIHESIKKIIPLMEGKPYNDNLLNDSKDALVRFYNALGYLHMDVDVKKDFQKNGRDLYLEFIIHEGRQTKIQSIRIAGNKGIDISEIHRVLQLKEGSPYNVIDVGDARHRVLYLYYRYGYIDASVDIESKIKKENAFITFSIIENKPSVIGKIIIRGNRKTKAKIIKREFTVKEGDPYNSEEIADTKQRLYRLGIFSKVSINMLEADRDVDGKVVRDVLVSLEEGKAGSVEIGLGYGDYEKFRGSFDISYRNLGGYHRQVGFRSELSTVEQRYILNFKEPWLFNKPNLPLKIFLMKEDVRAVNIETRDVLYKIDKFSFIAGTEKQLAKRIKAGLNYEYSFTDTTDVEPGVILSREDEGTIGIGSISPSLYYDSRDNPFDPTSGSLHGIVLKFASKTFLSETEFIKGTFQSSWFFQLIKGIVFAFSLKGGAAYGFESVEEIPLIERFFLGGRSTVRGYIRDTLGPKGADGNPTGGNIFALTNVELRFSPGKGFGLVTFVDGGNVWKRAEEIRSNLKYTAGVGLRYGTPVGPIRVDYGHKLDKEEGESSGEVHFTFGHVF